MSARGTHRPSLTSQTTRTTSKPTQSRSTINSGVGSSGVGRSPSSALQHGTAVPIAHQMAHSAHPPTRRPQAAVPTARQIAQFAYPTTMSPHDAAVNSGGYQWKESDSQRNTKDAVSSTAPAPQSATEQLGEERWHAKERKYVDEISELTVQIRTLQQKHSTGGRSGKEETVSGRYDEEIRNLKEENNQLRKKLKAVAIEKADLLNRLSQLAGAKLSDNNPDITDLSDPYRPQKLCDVYSELYDTTWTDAVETLPSKNEDGNIRFLLDIFKDSWTFCEVLAKGHMNILTDLLFNPGNATQERLSQTIRPIASQPGSVSYDVETMKSLKESRKLAARQTRTDLFQHFAYKYPKYGGSNEKVTNYTKACLSICWLSAIQDPPIEFIYNVQVGNKIELDLFRHYERTGDIVEYLVWPAMLLYKNGPLLAKGVVQVEHKTKRS